MDFPEKCMKRFLFVTGNSTSPLQTIPLTSKPQQKSWKTKALSSSVVSCHRWLRSYNVLRLLSTATLAPQSAYSCMHKHPQYHGMPRHICYCDRLRTRFTLPVRMIEESSISAIYVFNAGNLCWETKFAWILSLQNIFLTVGGKDRVLYPCLKKDGCPAQHGLCQALQAKTQWCGKHPYAFWKVPPASWACIYVDRITCYPQLHHEVFPKPHVPG